MKYTGRFFPMLLVAAIAVSAAVWAQERAQESKNLQSVTWRQMQAKIRAVLTSKAEKDMKGVVSATAEAPGSPKFFTINKTEATANALHGKSDDGMGLQRADMEVPGDIIRVDYSCSAPYDRCGHTYICDKTCGLNQSMQKGHHYTWWTKTDDGNGDVLYTFAVHYSMP